VVTVDHTRGNQVALRWLLYDGHGNLVRRMASDYTLSAFQWRGVWGEGQGSLGTGRGYCANLGHPEDETGLVYMRARYYEPATGRFISEDPARDGVNWYAYCENQPNDRADSNGRIWHVIGAGVLGGILGGISSAVNGGSFWKGFIGGFLGDL
jgi:RHS repeat-associated protein